MIVKFFTDKTITAAAEALERAVLANHFGVMQIHNLKAIMNKKGVEFKNECLIFEVCQPEQAKKVLEQSMIISTVLPCRISIYEEDGRVVLAMLKPTLLLAMFNVPQLEVVARDVENSLSLVPHHNILEVVAHDVENSLVKIMQEAVST
jgi:uncharacterized protein (DUF302 family)